MDENQVVESVETRYHDLDILLLLALTRSVHGSSNKRAVKEMVRQLWDRTVPAAQTAILRGMYYMKTDELNQQLNWHIADYQYYSIPATQLGALGFDGYAIHEKVVYPVEVHYETEDDYRWALKNEQEVWTGVCRSLLYDFRDAPRPEGTPRQAKAEILMFANKGYRGIPKHWGVQMNDDLPFYLGGLVAEDRSAPVRRFRPVNKKEQA